VRASEANRWLLVLLGVATLVYLPGLRAGFVWDDLPQVVGNQLTDSPRNLVAIFRTDVWSTAGVHVPDPPYYRPLFIATFVLDRMIGGLSPVVYHAQSIAWHLLAVAALFALARTLLSPESALVAAAAFALHPIQSEAVLWVSARTCEMAAVFVASAAAVLAPLDASWRRSASGAGFLLLGLLSKEEALFGVVLVLVLDFARHGRLGGFRRYGAMAIAVGIWAVLRQAAGVGASRAFAAQRIADVLGSVVDIVGIFGRLLVLPIPLTHGRRLFFLHEGPFDTGVGIAVLVAGAAFCIARGGRVAACCLAYAALSMCSSLLGIGATHQVGERYLYVPAIGIAIAVASAIRPSRRLVAVGAALAVGSIALIERRIPDWRSPVSFTESALRDYPSGAAFGELALALRDADAIDAAMASFHEALMADPPALDICEPYAETPLVVGDDRKALEVALETMTAGCAVSPAMSARHALAFARNGRWKEASASVAIAEQGSDPTFWLEVAFALADRSADGERIRALEARFPRERAAAEQEARALEAR
jgi:protein O-mannosyl-transferase